VEVHRVEVVISNVTDNTYWNGTTWVVAKTWLTATGTISWSYDMPSLSHGKVYQVRAKSIDKAGNESAEVMDSFTFDITPPTTPTNIEMTTPDTDRTLTFTWEAATDEISGVAYYEVSIDDALYTNIGNVTEYTHGIELALGDHIFRVRAVDKAGNIGKPGSLRFTLVAPPPPPPPPIPIWWWVIIAILVLGVAAVVVYRLRRR
jgi:predicted phage tail protein